MENRPFVSVVITTFNRPTQLQVTLKSIRQQNYPDLEIIVVDDGWDLGTRAICEESDAKYIKLSRPRLSQVRTPALPNNIGIRAAKGDVIVLQNAECKHVDPQCIYKLVSQVTDTTAVFARVLSLRPTGQFKMVYCGDPERKVGWFFCGAMKKYWFEKLRGFDQDYEHSGHDDTDFEVRMKKAGINFIWSDALVQHQWHVSGGRIEIRPMEELFRKKCLDMSEGRITEVRNLGRDWGVL